MEVAEIYSKLANRMVQGMMFHEQMANSYNFLGMKGYEMCHEYHFLEETCNYRKLCRYFVDHHNKLIPYSDIDDPDTIPESWYRYTRQDVDAGTKKNAVKVNLERWVSWEKGTKELYESCYRELMEAGEVASALFVAEFIRDVDCELKKAEKYHLNKVSTSYDLIAIMDEQVHKRDKYREKLRDVGKTLC